VLIFKIKKKYLIVLKIIAINKLKKKTLFFTFSTYRNERKMKKKIV